MADENECTPAHQVDLPARRCAVMAAYKLLTGHYPMWDEGDEDQPRGWFGLGCAEGPEAIADDARLTRVCSELLLWLDEHAPNGEGQVECAEEHSHD